MKAEAAQPARPGQATGRDSLACCTAFYAQDWVRALSRDCFHPGGEELTRRTVNEMRLSAGRKVADIGCGAGKSTRLLQEEFDLIAFGVDPGLDNLAAAVSNPVQAAGAPHKVHFIQAEAARLPFANSRLDAVLAECSFSLFPDQSAALAEFRRVLKPGGALGISDMSLNGGLPPDLEQKMAPWTCLQHALSERRYRALFEREGFVLQAFADESDGLLNMITQVKRNLLLLAAGTVMSRVSMPELDISNIRYWLERLREQVEKGAIRYLRFNLVSDLSRL